MAGHLMYIWAWVTSGGHPIMEMPDLLETFDESNQVGPTGMKSGLLMAFAAGTAAIYLASTRLLPSFLESPRTSSGLPRKGFLFGVLCGLASLILCASLMAFVDIVLDYFKHKVSIAFLPFAPLASSVMGLYLVGVPVAFIGGIIGSITELVLRRIYRTTAPPATSPDK